MIFRVHQGIWVVLLLFFLYSCGTEGESTTDQHQAPTDSIACTTPPHSDPIIQAKAQRIDSFFTRKYKAGAFNGTVLFAEEGVIVHKGAYGYADLHDQDTLTLEASFQLASVSKPLTATLILMLWEDGKLDLDQDIRDFFPHIGYEGITVKMLLSHRSGLPNYMYFAEEKWNRQVPITNADVVCLMEEYHPDIYYIPDYRYNYCNTNYSLLAGIIEIVTDTSYSGAMDQMLFKPLEMNESFVYNKAYRPSIDEEKGVPGFVGYRKEAGDSYLNGVVGDKGVYSSAFDLYKFDQALYGDELLSDSTKELAFTPAHEDLYIHDNYGLGWRVDESDPEKTTVWHNGWWKGFRTYFIRMVDQKKTIIILNNTTRGNFMDQKTLKSLLNDIEDPV